MDNKKLNASSKELFENWNNDGIKYCHWKSTEHLFDGLVGVTDMDVLLAETDKQRAEKILRQCAFVKVVSQFGSKYPYVEDWVGINNYDGKMVHLHLHFRIITGHKGLKEYKLPWTDEALETRIFDEENGTYIIEPSLELMELFTRIGLKAEYITILKSVFGKYYIPENTYREIVFLKERTKRSEVEKYIEKYYKKKSKDFIDLVYADSYDAKWFRTLIKLTIKVNYQYNKYVFPLSIIFRLYYQVAMYGRYAIRKIYKDLKVRKTLKENGFIIAFVGQDGAGKSTLTKDIEQWLTWKIEAKVLYLGSGDDYHDWKKKFITKDYSNRPLMNVFRKFLIMVYHKDVAKFMYRQMLKAQQLKKKGVIVILDRFPQMQFPGINDGPKIRTAAQNRKSNSIESRIINLYANKEENYIKKAVSIKPDLIFKMKLSVEESMRRKPDEDYQTVKKKHEIIEKLTFPQTDVKVIDATMNLKEEKIILHNLIWDKVVNK